MKIKKETLTRNNKVFMFKETAGNNQIQMVTCGEQSFKGVLFEGLVGISWKDWDDLVKWIGKHRDDL